MISCFVIRMQCNTVDKEACTTMREQVRKKGKDDIRDRRGFLENPTSLI